MLVVHKYGGSSVATTEKIWEIAKYLKNLHQNGDDLVVVVSAMGKTTNNLITLANNLSNFPNKREMDVLMSTGEMQSVALMSIALNELGVKAVSMSGAQAGFITNNNHMHAYIEELDVSKIKDYINRRYVVIVAGFQGVTKDQETTTFGRGGSDTTATALAAKLGCNCEIYTDVDAVCSVDPNLFGEAKKLHLLTYDEMMEMAVAGAKVLEPRSVELAKKYHVPLYLGKTLNSDKSKGTWVMDKVNVEEMGINSLSVRDDFCVVLFRFSTDESEYQSKIFEAINGLINFEMLQQSKVFGEYILSFGCSKTIFDEIKSRIEHSFMEDFEVLENCKRVSVIKDLCRITLVGVGLSTHTQIASDVFNLLLKNGIEYSFVANTEISISFAISQEDKQRTIDVLTKSLNL